MQSQYTHHIHTHTTLADTHTHTHMDDLVLKADPVSLQYPCTLQGSGTQTGYDGSLSDRV